MLTMQHLHMEEITIYACENHNFCMNTSWDRYVFCMRITKSMKSFNMRLYVFCVRNTVAPPICTLVTFYFTMVSGVNNFV